MKVLLFWKQDLQGPVFLETRPSCFFLNLKVLFPTETGTSRTASSSNFVHMLKYYGAHGDTHTLNINPLGEALSTREG
jgi:hypothetical protein